MRFSNDLTRRGAAVALTGALALGAAACGDDTDDATDTGSEMSEPADDAMSEPMESEMMSEPMGSEMMSEPMESEMGSEMTEEG